MHQKLGCFTFADAGAKLEAGLLPGVFVAVTFKLIRSEHPISGLEARRLPPHLITESLCSDLRRQMFAGTPAVKCTA